MQSVKIFVSYSHADFKPRPGLDVCRAGRILDDIRYELRCDSPRSPYKTLRDKDNILNISDDIDGKLSQAMENADLSLIFLSDSYCQSPSCQKEFDTLLNSGKPIVLIEIEKIWNDEITHLLSVHKEEVSKILATHFWSAKDGKVVRLGWPIPNINDLEYWEAIERIKISVVERGKEINKKRKGGETSRDKKEKERSTVFIACPTADVKPYAKRLEKTLKREGHSVFCFDPCFIQNANADPNEKLSDAIKLCDIYVQLLGGPPGKRIVNDKPLVRWQYEMAINLSENIHMWRSTEFDIDELEPQNALFLRNINSHLSSIEEFENYLLRKIKDFKSQNQTTQKKEEISADISNQSDLPLVSIDADMVDIELARKFTDALSKHVDVETLPFDLDKNILAESVKLRDAILLIYGDSIAGQKRTQSHFRLIRRHSRNVENKFKLAVGDAAPKHAPPCPRGPDIHIITAEEEIDENNLMNFVTQLRQQTSPSEKTN